MLFVTFLCFFIFFNYDLINNFDKFYNPPLKWILNKMIINKTRKFCSFLRRSMFNLEEFEFSTVSKNITNSVSTRNSKKQKV